MSNPLFAFTFHLTTVNVGGEKIVTLVYDETYSGACETVLNMGLPIMATSEKMLTDSIREVIQCTDDEEETTPS